MKREWPKDAEFPNMEEVRKYLDDGGIWSELAGWISVEAPKLDIDGCVELDCQYRPVWETRSVRVHESDVNRCDHIGLVGWGWSLTIADDAQIVVGVDDKEGFIEAANFYEALETINEYLCRAGRHVIDPRTRPGQTEDGER